MVTPPSETPHEYVVAGKTPGLTDDDVARAAHVIRTYGEPMKFYNDTRIYLVTPMGRKHWDMQGCTFDEGSVRLINRARTERIYGIQNMPRTSSGRESDYDCLANTWDRPRAKRDMLLMHYAPDASQTGPALDFRLAEASLRAVKTSATSQTRVGRFIASRNPAGSVA
ncbi:MAG: hypothetical protein QM708_02295 [Propioniciclava sp.]|uniref:hypothetical protein n=1 Tax=Propioniciclava sp. TaxID=2038686 RepID=UPI0039E27314